MMSLVLRPAALRRLAAPALPRALGRSLSSGTTLSTSSSASRFEGRGSTAVEEVNESLGFPREETDKAFVLGGAQQLFDRSRSLQSNGCWDDVRVLSNPRTSSLGPIVRTSYR